VLQVTEWKIGLHPGLTLVDVATGNIIGHISFNSATKTLRNALSSIEDVRRPVPILPCAVEDTMIGHGIATTNSNNYNDYSRSNY
jgi:hypothetical protein